MRSAFQRLTAVADLVFYLRWKLGHMLAQSGQVEDGVITEAVFASLFMSDTSFANARTTVDAAIRSCYSYGAIEPAAPPLVRNILQHFQDSVHLYGKRRVLTQEPAGVQARLSAEGIDF